MNSVPVVRSVTSDEAEWPQRDYIVIYDGDCRICTRVVETLREWDRDRKLFIVSSQTPGVKQRFAWIPEKNFQESLQLIAADGRAFQGARAIEELLTVLPRGRAVSWLFALPPVRPIAERLYRWFARNRFRLGCGDHCAYRPRRIE
jgi:predicted DCC family thiol-disulfide oxidoreductase YuxK